MKIKNATYQSLIIRPQYSFLPRRREKKEGKTVAQGQNTLCAYIYLRRRSISARKGTARALMHVLKPGKTLFIIIRKPFLLFCLSELDKGFMNPLKGKPAFR